MRLCIVVRPGRRSSRTLVGGWGRARRPRAAEPERDRSAYYTDDGKLIYAARVITGMPIGVLADLKRRLEPLAGRKSPVGYRRLARLRFGSPLVLSRVHWGEPKLVAEITNLTWAADGLLRHTVYMGASSMGRKNGGRPQS
jgi:ATP-dependent DNA ligase